MEKHEALCMNCFSERREADGDRCPICGMLHTKPQIGEGLAYGTVLDGRYVIGCAKGMNGEGITYAAYDETAKKPVRIHEFYPVSISERNTDHTIQPFDGKESVFEEYLDGFIGLSRNIGRLKEVTVINTVLDIFEENYTAYAVYEYIPTVSLKRYVEKEGVLVWNRAYNLFFPVMTALGVLHSLGGAHFGVSPETVRVTQDGSLLLSGFHIAAARQAGTDLIEELYEGCYALEQVSGVGHCGEATDVYGFAATLLFALTGQLPLAAQKRVKDPRLLIAKEYLKELPPYAITALANALQVQQEMRTVSFERLRVELTAQQTVVNEVRSAGAIKRLPPKETATAHRGLPPFIWLIGACVVTLVALVVIVNARLAENGMGFSDLKDLIEGKKTESQVDAGVPNMIGTRYADWENRVAFGECDFKLSPEWVFSDTIEEGFVISQSPNFGEPKSVDNTIAVTVSRGSEYRLLPEIKGMSFEELKPILEKNGFTVVREDRTNPDITPGYVINYLDRAEGDSLVYGSSVTVLVSSGEGEAPQDSSAVAEENNP